VVLIGDKFGFYKTLAAAGTADARRLASKTGTVERTFAEWASGQAGSRLYQLRPTSGALLDFARAALVLADENGPAFVPPCTNSTAAIRDDQSSQRVSSTAAASDGTTRPLPVPRHRALLRPATRSSGVRMDSRAHGFKQKLEARRAVADVGCGHGAS